MQNGEVDVTGVCGTLFQLQHLWAFAGQRALMMDKAFKTQIIQKGGRLIDAAHHLRRIEDVTHTIECDGWQWRLKPLHDC